MGDVRQEDDPPDGEVYVVEGDGPPPAGRRESAGSPRPPLPIGRRIAVALVAVAVFAFGIVVGRTSLGTHTSAGPSVASLTTAVSPTVPTPTSRSSEPARMSSVTAHTDEPTGPAVDREPWPLAPAACGGNVPTPIIDAVTSRTRPVSVRVITGGNPTPVNVADRSVGDALFTPDDAHYVRAVASASDITVLLVAPCQGGGQGRVVRIAGDATTSDVALPDDATYVQLLSGGGLVWVAVSASSYGYGSVTLIAADGSGDTVELPAGLQPLGARGSLIVGQYASGGMPSGVVAVFDTAKGRVSAQFGTANPEGANAIAAGDYVVTAPWYCGDHTDSCRIHRYDLGTGKQHSVRLNPVMDRILAGGGAISPDGSIAAVRLYDQPPSPAPLEPNPLPSTGPRDTTRIGLIDLDDGSVRALPGLTLGSSAGPAMAFSPDGRWLIIAVAAGDRTQLLLYTAAGGGPYHAVDVPGLVLRPSIALGR